MNMSLFDIVKKLCLLTVCNRKSIFIVFMTALCYPIYALENYWDLVLLGKSASQWPNWSASFGKAEVQIEGENITINGYIKQATKSNHEFEFTPDPQYIIKGVKARNGKIVATVYSQSTDEDSYKIYGLYTRKLVKESIKNGSVDAVIEEIVFPYPENHLFWGLSSKEIKGVRGSQ